MQRFETQYPITAREDEIKQILRYITKGQSCQLISVPGAGRSTVLRLLAYHEKLRQHHLREGSTLYKVEPYQRYLFVYINFAEVSSFETAELNKVLFLAILASLRELGPNKEPATSIGKEIYALFKEALSLNDPLVLFQYLKKAVENLTVRGRTPIFLFDRFSEFAEKTSADFFANLRTLRLAAGGKLAVAFSTHRPLEDLLPPHHWQDFYEFFVGNHVFLDMHDNVATDFRIEVLEKEYGKTLDPKIKAELVRLTGGHGKLMKLSTQIFLSRSVLQKNTSEQAEIRTDLISTLLSHILIKGSLLEIWQALTREEKSVLRQVADQDKHDLHSPSLRSFHLPFPLLTDFVRRNIAEQLVPKTIRFDEKTNEIYFGDESIEGLTPQEFRLLKCLINNPNHVSERDEIIQAVWSDTKTAAGVSDEALDQMVHRVRKKIEDEADNPKHLLTVKGRGFRFIP